MQLDKWLFQKNIWNEYGYDRFLNSVQDAGVSHEEVHIIPFTDTFDREIDFVPKYVFGSNRFINVCRAQGFPTFKSFKPIEDFYMKSDWINANGYDIKWGELKKAKGNFIHPQFIKPHTEKFFTGKICYSLDDIDKTQLATSFIENEDDELVRVSYAIDIYDEARFFIVGGEIISASLYKINKQNKQVRIDKSHPAWEQCRNILSSGFIDDAFVMDLGSTSTDFHCASWKIVELNNINSAGLYETDTDAIVSAFKHL
jgi:hypothetical protein